MANNEAPAKEGPIQAGLIFATTTNNVKDMKQKFPLPLVAGVLSVLGAGLALLFITRKKSKQAVKRPPRKAPQLNIVNPGTQDEFPKPPMESEIG